MVVLKISLLSFLTAVLNSKQTWHISVTNDSPSNSLFCVRRARRTSVLSACLASNTPEASSILITEGLSVTASLLSLRGLGSRLASGEAEDRRPGPGSVCLERSSTMPSPRLGTTHWANWARTNVLLNQSLPSLRWPRWGGQWRALIGPWSALGPLAPPIGGESKLRKLRESRPLPFIGWDWPCFLSS